MGFQIFAPSVSLGGPNLDVEASLQTDTRAGWFSTGIHTPSARRIEVELIPALRFILQTPRLTTTAQYSLALLNQWTHLSSNFTRERFRILHQFDVTHRYQLSRRTDWFSSANIAWGTTSYNPDLFLFGAQDALASTRPETDTLRLMTIGSTTGVTHNVTRRQAVTIAAGYTSSRQFGERAITPDGRDVSIPTMHDTGGSAEYSAQVSSRDRFLAAVRGRYITFSTGSKNIPITPRLGWDHLARRNMSWGVQAGSTILLENNFNGRNPAPAKYFVSVIPMLLGTITWSPNLNTDTRWTFNTQFGIDSYVDPIRAQVLPRIIGRVGATGQINPQMMVQFDVTSSVVIIDSETENAQELQDLPVTATARTALNIQILQKLNFIAEVASGTSSTNPFGSDVRLAARQLYAGISLIATLSSGDREIE